MSFQYTFIFTLATLTGDGTGIGRMIPEKWFRENRTLTIISVGYLQVETFPNPKFLRLNSGISGSRKARKETRSGCVRGSHFWQPLKNYQLTHSAPKQSPPTVVTPPGRHYHKRVPTVNLHLEPLVSIPPVMLCSELLSSKTGPWVTECVWRCVCARVCACAATTLTDWGATLQIRWPDARRSLLSAGS